MLPSPRGARTDQAGGGMNTDVTGEMAFQFQSDTKYGLPQVGVGFHGIGECFQ